MASVGPVSRAVTAVGRPGLVTGAWVKDQKVEVAGGQITAYQVVLEVTFILD